MPTNKSIQTLAVSLSLVLAGLTPVSVFPPFNTPRELPAIGVIFSEAPNFDYVYTDYGHQATQAAADALAAQQATQAAADALAAQQTTQAAVDALADQQATEAAVDALAVQQNTEAAADAQVAADALANPVKPVTPPPAPTQQPPLPPTAQPTKSFQSPLLYGFRVKVTLHEIECSQLGPDCEYDYYYDYDYIDYSQQATQSAADAQVAADVPSAQQATEATVELMHQTFDGQCRRCDQTVIGRFFEYSRALKIIQEEHYLGWMDFDEERKKRDLTAKNPSESETKYARVLGSDKRSRHKRQTGKGFISAAPPICGIVPC